MIHNKQYITFYTTTEQKLRLCKLLKQHLNIGLKDSKELMDRGLNNLGIPNEIVFEELHARVMLIKEIRNDIPELKFEVTGDVQSERRKFFLDMDMGGREDYVKFLGDNYIHLLFNSSPEGIKNIINDLISRLDIESLKDIYKEYCEKEESYKTHPKDEQDISTSNPW